MAKVLVVHRDNGARQMLEAMLARAHDVAAAKDFTTGVRQLRKQHPALVVAGIDAKHVDALLLLRHMSEYGPKVPMIVVAGRGSGQQQHAALRLGAKAFLEYPVEEARFTSAVEAALGGASGGNGSVPALTDEERDANLSDMVKQLNGRMQCFAGRNLVYLQNYIGSGTRSRPRVCLKCPLRKEFGLEPNVYYEFIRDVCCGDPHTCEAVQRFEARQNR